MRARTRWAVGGALAMAAAYVTTTAIDPTTPWDGPPQDDPASEVREVGEPLFAPCSEGDADAEHAFVTLAGDDDAPPPVVPAPTSQDPGRTGPLTYGRDESYDALDGARPDLVHLVGVDGVGGYAFREQLDRLAAHGGELGLRTADLAVVVGTYRSPDGVGYPRNAAGQTYGIPNTDTGARPDLTELVGDDCVTGYVATDLVEDLDLRPPGLALGAPDLGQRWVEVDLTDAEGDEVVGTYTGVVG